MRTLGLHKVGLVLRQHLSPVLVHPYLGGDGRRGALTVAGEHDDLAHSQAVEGSYRIRSLGAQRVGDADNRGQHAANRQIQMAVLLGQGVEGGLLSRRDSAALILKDEVGAANDDPPAVYRTGDAVGHQVLHLGVHLLMGQIPLPGGLNHGVGHGVGEMLLQAGAQPEHFQLLVPTEWDHLSHHGVGMGQGTRLVKNNGIRLGHSFQVLSTFHGHMEAAGLAHGGENRQRHGQFQSAGEVHHQHGQGAGDIAGEQIDQHTPRQRVGYQSISQMRCVIFRCGLELLRLLNHGHDLVIAALAGLLGDRKDALALLHHRSGIDAAPRPLGDGDGLAGEGRLVEHDLALRNGAVQGNHAAHADDHLISGLYLVERDQFLSAFGFHPDPVDIQGHAPGQVFHGLFVGPLLQKLAQPQQEHHGTGRVEVPPYHGQADGDSIQQLHMELSPQQTPKRPEQIRSRPNNCVDRTKRSREEQGSDGLKRHHTHQFFLIGTVERPAAVDRDQLRQRMILIGEASENPQ